MSFGGRHISMSNRITNGLTCAMLHLWALLRGHVCHGIVCECVKAHQLIAKGGGRKSMVQGYRIQLKSPINPFASVKSRHSKLAPYGIRWHYLSAFSRTFLWARTDCEIGGCWVMRGAGFASAVIYGSLQNGPLQLYRSWGLACPVRNCDGIQAGEVAKAGRNAPRQIN